MQKQIPSIPYRLFFLFIEPISAVVGAYYAAVRPDIYLSLLSSDAKQSAHLIPTPVTISLYQLSNLYLLFALNEFVVLTSTNSLTTWRRLLFCLLIADIGHLMTMWPLAVELGMIQVYVRFWDWNAMEWGSIGFVYVGALMRASFLLGLGIKIDARKEDVGKQE